MSDNSFKHQRNLKLRNEVNQNHKTQISLTNLEFFKQESYKCPPLATKGKVLVLSFKTLLSCHVIYSSILYQHAQ
jgi:hypothetical protein